jgi:ATP-dependent DNA helicase RecG
MLLTHDEIVEKILLGENTFTQFKREITNTVGLAEEIVAMANTKGGYILVGVDDNGKIVGLNNINLLNQLIANASSENVVPSVHIYNESVLVDGKIICVISIPEGRQKPYRTKQGRYLMRSGADKRVASQEEMSRMFQGSGFYHQEELAISGTKIPTDLSTLSFELFFELHYKQTLSDYLAIPNQTLEILLNNMNLAKGHELTLIGLMVFGNNPQKFRPILVSKAVSFYGNDITDTKYLSSQDIDGNIMLQFEKGINFLTSNLLQLQKTKTFNSLGESEISLIALEEHLVNALLHRDYSINSSIKLLVFQNRIEIISPGCLTNHLTIENVKNGNAIARNPILTSFATKMLPYRGLGSGIRRALEAHPNTELINDVEGKQFTVILHRPQISF